VLAGLAAMPGMSQTQIAPSTDSGINPADTYLVADITLQGQSSLSLPEPVFSATLNATTSSLQIQPDEELPRGKSVMTSTARW